jgi:hypothetical protein
MSLAARFVQPDLSAPSLDDVVLDFHPDRGADARESAIPSGRLRPLSFALKTSNRKQWEVRSREAFDSFELEVLTHRFCRG